MKSNGKGGGVRSHPRRHCRQEMLAQARAHPLAHRVVRFWHSHFPKADCAIGLRLRKNQGQRDFGGEDATGVVTTKRNGCHLMFRPELLIDVFGKRLPAQ